MIVAATLESAAPPFFSNKSAHSQIAQRAFDPLTGLSGLSQLRTLVLNATQQELRSLGQRADNWDGAGSLRPDDRAIGQSLALIQIMYEEATATEFAWARPHVSSSEEGEIVLEWWRNAHKLTVYIGARSIECIKVWGSNIADEMESVSLGGEVFGDAFRDFWRWLYA